MVDFDQLWKAVPEREAMRVTTAIGSIRRVEGLSQYVVSGDIGAAAAGVGVDASGVGALGLVSGDVYSVRLARDRMLIVSNKELALEPGWNNAGYAVTDMSALGVFEIDGALADEIVSRATTPPLAGPSAAISFARVEAVLYRCRKGEAVRVHVDPSLTPYVWNWFQVVLPMISG